MNGTAEYEVIHRALLELYLSLRGRPLNSKNYYPNFTPLGVHPSPDFTGVTLSELEVGHARNHFSRV